MKDLTSLLFETSAFKVAPENKPFWYTSGKIGPYFINADYFYGSKEDSKTLLDFIDSELENEDKKNIPEHIFSKTLLHYNQNSIYKFVIDYMIEYIKDNINLDDIDYISGGERRDWLFSNIIAYFLKKPHVTIYKDFSTILSNSDFSENNVVSSIENKNFLHIADLLNQGVSFTRNWIPAINKLGSSIKWATFVIDRMDGGTQVLADNNVEALSLLQIDNNLFRKALELNFITEKQLNIIKEFKKDQITSMKKFLVEHPEFIQESLNSSDPKASKYSKIMVEQDIYGLNK